MFAWEYLDMDDLLHVVCKQGVKDETVVKIETVIQMDDESIFTCAFSEAIPDGGPWGGREILQEADPKAGVYRQKGVAKVIMFRSPSYCVFGNPNGDPTISDYYLPEGYAVMFGSQLDAITARLRHEQEEAERKERERKARLLAEQQPLIDEWRDRLIGLSACLTLKEREQVAIDNLKTVLRAKFPGTTFRIKTNRYGETSIGWEDGPTERDVMQAADLFNGWLKPVEHTPWMQQFGRLEISAGDLDRKMNVLTKARILQQLGQVTEAFREGGIDDEVTVTDFDWLMLHLLAGISVDASDDLCMSTLKADGTRAVNILAAVRFIFRHTAYTKTAKPKKSAKKAA